MLHKLAKTVNYCFFEEKSQSYSVDIRVASCYEYKVPGLLRVGQISYPCVHLLETGCNMIRACKYNAIETVKTRAGGVALPYKNDSGACRKF